MDNLTHRTAPIFRTVIVVVVALTAMDCSSTVMTVNGAEISPPLWGVTMQSGDTYYARSLDTLTTRTLVVTPLSGEPTIALDSISSLTYYPTRWRMTAMVVGGLAGTAAGILFASSSKSSPQQTSGFFAGSLFGETREKLGKVGGGLMGAAVGACAGALVEELSARPQTVELPHRRRVEAIQAIARQRGLSELITIR